MDIDRKNAAEYSALPRWRFCSAGIRRHRCSDTRGIRRYPSRSLPGGSRMTERQPSSRSPAIPRPCPALSVTLEKVQQCLLTHLTK